MSGGMKGDSLSYAPGQIIFEEGEGAHSLFFIKEGKIAIFRVREGVEVDLGEMGAGEVLGTLALFSKEPRSASARAITPVILSMVPAESAEIAFKSIPVWVQAIVKDSVARLKQVDQRLVESKLVERKLRDKVGTAYHHASQLASLLVALLKTGMLKIDEQDVFPMNGFFARAEGVLLQRADYLEQIFNCIAKGGVVKQVKAGNYGICLHQPKAQVLESFAQFALGVGKSGSQGFANLKHYPWMSALIRVQKKHPDKESWERDELIKLLHKEQGRAPSATLLDELRGNSSLRVIPGNKITFSPIQLQRRMAFETVCREIRDAGFDDKSS